MKTAAFENLLSGAFEKLPEDDILKAWRMRAWDHFLELGLPTKKNEDFAHVGLQKIFSENFTLAKPHSLSREEILPHVLPECAGSYLVFINGFFDEELSDTKNTSEKVVLMNLAFAMKSYGVFMQNRLAKTLKEDLNPFTALNAALQGKGIFLYLPPGIEAIRPIQILNITLAEKNTISSPRLQIYVGKNSQLSCFQTQIDLGQNTHFQNSVMDAQIEENAKLYWYEQGTFAEEGYYISSKRASLKQDAHFKCIGYQVGSKVCYQDTRIVLAEEKSSCDYKYLSLVDGANEASTLVRVDHTAPHTESSQLKKSMLKGSAKASFEGKIVVNAIAQKTDAYQMSRSLLLSDKANSYAKPNLEVFADDVKASHGSTTSMIDEEELFYLQSRGLSEEDAEKLLANAFCKEISQEFPFDISLPTRFMR